MKYALDVFRQKYPDFQEALTTVNSLLGKLDLILGCHILTFYAYQESCYYECLFALTRLSSPDPFFEIFQADGCLDKTMEYIFSTHTSGKTYHRFHPKDENRLETMSFPEFSSLKELEMKLKLMGKI